MQTGKFIVDKPLGRGFEKTQTWKKAGSFV
jgi:hypothetical protein